MIGLCTTYSRSTSTIMVDVGPLQTTTISLNLRKCIFCVPFGNLLGHIVCREGVLVDPTKVAVILNMPPPTTVKQL
jgi:hypothetical protein